MRQILQWIRNAPASEILMLLFFFVAGMATCAAVVIRSVNRQRRKAISEFDRRRKEMQERMDRGARRTG
jgi:hypothetical protein